MEKLFDIDLDNFQPNFYTRTSRNNSRSKNDEIFPISKMEDFQTSISIFSTRIESKKYNLNSENKNTNNKTKKKKKNKKKVEFNPLITVVNIESYKKENYEGTFDSQGKCTEEIFNNNDAKKCLMCSVF